jgi:hypothetical protein
MRQILTWTFILITCLTGYGQTKSAHKYGIVRQIDSSSVITVDIGKQKDTTVIKRQLTADQIKIFIDKWNHSKGESTCRFIVQYYVYVKLKDGSQRLFRTNGADVKDGDTDWCYDLGDKNFIEKLWTKAKK